MTQPSLSGMLVAVVTLYLPLRQVQVHFSLEVLDALSSVTAWREGVFIIQVDFGRHERTPFLSNVLQITLEAGGVLWFLGHGGDGVIGLLDGGFDRGSATRLVARHSGECSMGE